MKKIVKLQYLNNEELKCTYDVKNLDIKAKQELKKLLVQIRLK